MLDIERNRAAVKWSPRELAARMAWGVAQPFFRWSPRPFWGWRRGILRWFGARMGKEARVDPRVRIFAPWNLEIGDWSAVGFDVLLYNLGPIRIGKRVTVSQRAHLCAGTHDMRRADMPLLKSGIELEDDTWVCADAFVGPGVRVGEGAVVGARAVVMRPVAAWQVVAGNPARPVGVREIRADDVGSSRSF